MSHTTKKIAAVAVAAAGLATLDYHLATVFLEQPISQALRLWFALCAAIAAVLLLVLALDHGLRRLGSRCARLLWPALAYAVLLAVLFAAAFWLCDLLHPRRRLYAYLLHAHFAYCGVLLLWVLARFALRRRPDASVASPVTAGVAFVYPLWDMAGIVFSDERRRANLALAVLAALLAALAALNYSYEALYMFGRQYLAVHDHLSIDMILASAIFLLLWFGRMSWNRAEDSVAAPLLAAGALVAASVWALGPEASHEVQRRELGRVCVSTFRFAWRRLEAPVLAFDEPGDVFAPRDLLALSRHDRELQGRPVILVLVDTLRFDLVEQAWREDPASFPGFRRFADVSARFDRFYTPGNATGASIPHLLHGDYFKTGDRFVAECEAMGYQVVYARSLLSSNKGDFLAQDLDMFYRPADEVVSLTLREFDRLDWSKPVYCYLHLLDLHSPYVREGGEYVFFNKDNLREYMRQLRLVDGQLLLLYEDLERRGVLGSGCVIVTGDHGEEFAHEHNFTMHSINLFEQLVRVPTMVHFPGQTQGETVAAPVSAVGLIPSLLSRMDPARYPRPAPPRGGERCFFASNYTDEVGLVHDGFKAMYSREGNYLMLFDLQADPMERYNLAEDQPDKMRAEFAYLALYRRLLDEVK